jgi:L-ascorbate metabolism protein UlaG (beta-lactamase superfamily)
MTVTCTYSANCGISLTVNGTRIWIDAVHSVRMEPYSPVSEAMWATMKTHPDFTDPCAILFTHCHDDHFSAAMTEEAMRLWPDAKVYLPGSTIENAITLKEKEERFRAGALDILAVRTYHEGEEDRFEPHYSFFIGDGEERVFVSGDAEVGCRDLRERFEGQRIHTAVCIFPWLTLGRGRDAIRESMRPDHLLICHIPFAEDDAYGFRSMIEAMAKLHPDVADTRFLTEPFQKEVFL